MSEYLVSNGLLRNKAYHMPHMEKRGMAEIDDDS